MAIPGYRWIRGLVPEATYNAASKAKDVARVTWDDAVATALALYIERAAQRPTIGSPTPAAEAPKLSSAIVPDIPGDHVEALEVEAAPTFATIARSADEFLRDLGHEGYQRGIALQASATLSGAAVFTAKVE
jgi:hypothetical protein